MSGVLLEFSGVSKRFCLRPELRVRFAAIDIARELCGLPPADGLRSGEFWSLRDIDLQVRAGEVLGVIGHNGAGKSTLLNLAAGTLLPTTGTITKYARNVCKIDPFGMMNPHETARENITLQLVYHGISAAEIDGDVAAIADFADLADRLDEIIGTYSSGMRARLGFAIFSRLRPDVFLVDEALGGGDRRFHDQFSVYLREYVADGGAMLLCAHAAHTIQSLCDRVLLLDHGRVMLMADAPTAIDAYNALAAERGSLPMPGFRRQAGRPVQPGGHLSGPASGGGAAATDRAPGLRVIDLRIGGTTEGDLIPGAAAEIRIRCAAAVPVEGVVCVVEIGSGGWFPVAVIEGPATTIVPEGTDLCCDVASLPLAPGDYDVHVRLSDAESGASLADTSGRVPFRFHVRSTEPSRRVGRDRSPVVHVAASWQPPATAGSRGPSPVPTS